MFHKIKDIQVLPEHKLNIHFVEGLRKIYDVNALSEKHPVFKQLTENDELFNSVKVDVGGYAIVWNDDLDLSCDELWENGEKQDSPLMVSCPSEMQLICGDSMRVHYEEP